MLEISRGDAQKARFDVTGCVFGRRVSGVFALYFETTAQTFVAQHCQTEGGDRLSIYTPDGDSVYPVFELYADRVNYRLYPDRITVTSRMNGEGFSIDWQPGGRPAAPELSRPPDPGTLETPLLARQLGLANLDKALRDPDRRREIAGHEAEWDGWARLLNGGWSVEQVGAGQLRATLPADRVNWPKDLDPASHFYGDRPGARLLAAPHSAAPALFPIHRKVLVRGPDLPGDENLAAAGWIYLCAGRSGCGFARLADVGRPDGPVATFIRQASDDPWKLENLVRD
ncbi:MAG: hypothetical protein AAF317_08345 [Pseudomonadota bacterium]